MQITDAAGVPVRQPPERLAMLAVAVIAYVIASWAWALMGPLAPILDEALGLTPVQQALAVSLTVVVGALGRVPVGALTDRFGGRVMFVVVAAATIVALLVLATAGTRSAVGLLAGAALLGIAGTMLTVSVPFVSAWFAGGSRGLALGAVGAGLCGNAIAGFTAVRLVDEYSLAAPFLVGAAMLAVFALVAGFAARNAPALAASPAQGRGRFASALRLPVTRRAALWYAVGFASFATFTAALPLYLVNTYQVSAVRAGDVLGVVVIVSVLTRPLGGWLADRLEPARPLAVALIAITVAATVQAFTPPLPVMLAATLPVLAVGLGVLQTTIMAQLAVAVPPPMIGLVIGLVSTAAGVAGFLAPLVMAISFTRTGGYGPALWLIAALNAVAAVNALINVRRSPLAGRARTLS
ncbi:MFS transporter [Actinoplanes sp. NPDC024001]|uniref:MFS transporter n=1 Tax=Actinoplanes sp. NPDC024001 TaxID=3154598 RepID=UPI00340C706A